MFRSAFAAARASATARITLNPVASTPNDTITITDITP